MRARQVSNPTPHFLGLVGGSGVGWGAGEPVLAPKQGGWGGWRPAQLPLRCLFTFPSLLLESQKHPGNSCKITHAQLIRVQLLAPAAAL